MNQPPFPPACSKPVVQENVYPIGPSLQFYKLFLSKEVSGEFAQYDAIASLEWDVVVAHDKSFERLYHAAFTTAEPFWVKGSTLAGTEFHETATVPHMWFILGHLNGNAICESSRYFQAHIIVEH